MKILIIGGSGFVGANLAIKFKDDGFDVSVLDNLVRRGSEQNLPLFKVKGIPFIHGDTRNKEDISCLPHYDIILDCAAQPSAINYSNPNFDITNNTYGVLNVLDYCRDHDSSLIFWSTNKCYTGNICNKNEMILEGVNRFIFNSECKFEGFDPKYGFNENLNVNGKDHSIYGVSKVMADLMIQEYSDSFGINSICNRFSCLAGPKQWGKAEQGWLSWFAIANILKLPIEVIGFNGFQVRDYLFIDDLYVLIKKQTEALVLGDKKYNGEVFNVGGGMDYNISIKEAILFLEENLGKFVKIDYLDTPRRADQMIYISDIRKASNEFDWSPSIDIKFGYESIFKWIYDNEKTLKFLYN